MEEHVKRSFKLFAIGAFAIIVLVALQEGLRNEPRHSVEDILKVEPTPIPEVLGLNRKKILVNRFGASVWFRVETEPICEFGGFDHLVGGMWRSRSRNALISVEPLVESAGDEKRRMHRLYLADVAKGRNFTFTFPFSWERRHYGLFVCTDASRSDRCAEKPLYNFRDPYGTEKPGDSVYFFIYFMVRGDEVEFFDPTASARQLDQLRSYLQAAGDLEPSELESVLDTVGRFSKYTALTRGEVDTQESRIVAVFPRREFEGCANVRQSILGANIRSRKIYSWSSQGKKEEIFVDTPPQGQPSGATDDAAPAEGE